MRVRLRSIFHSRPYLYGITAGAMMFAVVYIVDAVMVRIHLRPEATIIDDLLLAFVVAVLVVSLEAQHQREQQLQQERIRMILGMNHHIRNALQAIVYVTADLKGEHATIVQEATDRIEWALREILPGEQSQPTPANRK